jgi:hypothetical protein
MKSIDLALQRRGRRYDHASQDRGVDRPDQRAEPPRVRQRNQEFVSQAREGRRRAGQGGEWLEGGE